MQVSKTLCTLISASIFSSLSSVFFLWYWQGKQSWAPSDIDQFLYSSDLIFDLTVIMCADSPHYPLYFFYGTDKENSHELLQILINSFIFLILCLIQQWSCVQILLIILHMFFYGTDKENQFNNHELLQILINFFILVIFCLIHQQWCKEKLVASHSEG